MILYLAADTNDDDEHNVILFLWMTNQWMSENLFFQNFSPCFGKKFLDLKESVYLLNSFNQSNITELKKKLYISTFKLGIFKRKKTF